jgi:hypothetical protein
MPEIVKLHDALNPQELYDEIESKKPIITGSNIPNNCDTVDYNIDHITLYFDKAMIIGNNGSTRGSQEYAFPEDTEKNSEWNSDSMQWTVYVKLNPNTEYQIVYPNQFFRDSKAFFHPKETYTLTFKTKPAQ